MRAKKITVGLGVIATAMSVMTLAPSSAYADYAPSSQDVVAVGSDTLQAGFDFLADGDHLGDGGYNTGKRNKFVSIDATADANTRLAYGAQGVGAGADKASNSCSPGNGGTPGTGNQNAQHLGDKPCTLNPTVVLRSGKSPVQRPNGSGAGYNLLVNDTNATGGYKATNPIVDFARSSSQQPKNVLFDQLQIGNDPLGMLTSTTTNAAPALSISQLNSIYSCTNTPGGTNFRDWGSVGGAAGNTIVPLLPQLGSGTRNYFLGAIGLTDSTVGSCVQNVEENDPEAIDASGSPANAIEPMSQSRLFLFQGKLATGAPNGVGGYFKDPSCVQYQNTTTVPTAANCASNLNTLNPNVKLETSGTPTAGGDIFYPTRALYVYFRHSDLASTKAFQPGIATNWVKTLLYDPANPNDSYLCSTGQDLISAAGIQPTCVYTPGGGK